MVPCNIIADVGHLDDVSLSHLRVRKQSDMSRPLSGLRHFNNVGMRAATVMELLVRPQQLVAHSTIFVAVQSR